VCGINDDISVPAGDIDRQIVTSPRARTVRVVLNLKLA
jgi:hypothetical protein